VQAEEESSFAGTLLDLAERAEVVTFDLGSTRLRGVVVGVGADFVAVRTPAGQRALVPSSAIDSVRAEPGSAEVRGDRRLALEVTFAAVLGPVAAERPEVLVRTTGDVTVRGVLRAAGSDVVRIRVDGERPVPAWVPLAAVRLLVLDPG
jgi:hypothetical protein